MPGGAIEIVGAGPAGLAAAITLARSGRSVRVYEAARHVGNRFDGDLQGLENWTSELDVLGEFHALGLSTGFEFEACSSGIAFDAWGHTYPMHGNKPIFYLVERGPGPASLDTILLRQALDSGVEIRFNSRVEQVGKPAILACGPKSADAISVGYHFKTTAGNGFWVICDNNLAPEGYAYLLIMNGKGTVKSCMFTDFMHEKNYVERTVSRFRELVEFDMLDPRPHGGAGNFRLPHSLLADGRPLAGEQSGLQDILWGFGIRLAIRSGVLAARALIENENYDELWRCAFEASMRASAVNRATFARFGNFGMRLFLTRLALSRDVREYLGRHYRYSWTKRLLLRPWAKTQFGGRYPSSRYDHGNSDPG